MRVSYTNYHNNATIQETIIQQAISELKIWINQNLYYININHINNIPLQEMNLNIKKYEPNINSISFPQTYCIKPDGGIFYIENIYDIDTPIKYPVLILESKTQGVNKSRIANGQQAQNRGNAIERANNSINSFITWLKIMDIGILPYICFCSGDDFSSDSSIYSRIVRGNGFLDLNQDNLFKRLPSFYVSENMWNLSDIISLSKTTIKNSIQYYFVKFGKDKFIYPKYLNIDEKE